MLGSSRNKNRIQPLNQVPELVNRILPAIPPCLKRIRLQDEIGVDEVTKACEKIGHGASAASGDPQLMRAR
jgi:hypothetical protein